MNTASTIPRYLEYGRMPNFFIQIAEGLEQRGRLLKEVIQVLLVLAKSVGF
jgi:hypothetical protein